MCCMWRLVAARGGRLQLTTTLLPHPFGPTTQVKSAKGPIKALSLKLLKPVVDRKWYFEVLARTVLVCGGRLDVPSTSRCVRRSSLLQLLSACLATGAHEPGMMKLALVVP